MAFNVRPEECAGSHGTDGCGSSFRFGISPPQCVLSPTAKVGRSCLRLASQRLRGAWGKSVAAIPPHCRCWTRLVHGQPIWVFPLHHGLQGLTIESAIMTDLTEADKLKQQERA